MERRLTAADVCERLQRSEATLYRRIAAGAFPKPIEPGRWLESAVDAAIKGDVNAPSGSDAWRVDADAIREAEAAAARRRQAARRRDLQRALPRPPRSAPRLAVIDTAPPKG